MGRCGEGKSGRDYEESSASSFDASRQGLQAAAVGREPGTEGDRAGPGKYRLSSDLCAGGQDAAYRSCLRGAGGLRYSVEGIAEGGCGFHAGNEGVTTSLTHGEYSRELSDPAIRSEHLNLGQMIEGVEVIHPLRELELRQTISAFHASTGYTRNMAS